jgi:hypothetical protein
MQQQQQQQQQQLAAGVHIGEPATAWFLRQAALDKQHQR